MKSLKGPLSYDDKDLIHIIKNKYLEPPSSKPYNIIQHAKLKKHSSELFYDKHIEIILKDKNNGFFVEAGAMDGQTMSNTLRLEKKQGWTGLLVEPDPSNYILLKKKHRKAWTVNACLSLKPYPKQEKLWYKDIIAKKHEYLDPKHRAMSSVVEERKKFNIIKSDGEYQSFYYAQCLPLGSLLLAMNISRVDLLSLDVEFVEDKIISNFQFDQFDIQVILLEWWNLDTVKWLNDFLSSKGFVFVANSRSDYIFVKRGSEYEKIVKKKIPKRIFNIWREIPLPKYALNSSFVY
ncbi:UNVERIFIED_CONTAM: hypothetical protein RMT77_003719 [Armadillidium vulgare]